MGTFARSHRETQPDRNLFAEPFFEEHGWTRVPHLVQWMVTLDCPLHCPHCLAIDSNGKGHGTLTLPEATRLISEIAEIEAREFLLTGGEPLCHPEFPAVVEMLREYAVPWSLNTSCMPDERNQRALLDWPPGFVAVSLDGPERVHDRFRGRNGSFRETLNAISFFSKLAPGNVTAGTTVTTKNMRYLPQTFQSVLESGASAWGLHLLVLEGRARRRRDLFLSRRQIRSLLRFVAAKRQYFPITLADEIGFCGPLDPLLRDRPFYCGAGRAQCVVLPDGEVVPCTTLDRSASAGNILETPLREIWNEGFSGLRNWQPRGRCRSCQYAPACEGGCWLQRRHGTHCFKDAWEMPRLARTAASLTVCFGLAVSGGEGAGQEKEPKPSGGVWAGRHELLERCQQEATSELAILQTCIIQWYAAGTGSHRSPSVESVRQRVETELGDDPGAAYFLAFMSGERPAELEARVQEILSALETKQRSLCLIGLMWRDIAEWCFETGGPSERSDEDTALLGEVLRQIESAASTWRKEIFEQKLDPYFFRPGCYRAFFMSKAGPPPDERLGSSLAKERWGPTTEITEKFLEEHPFAESMELDFTVEPESGLILESSEGSQPVMETGRLGVFDLLVVPKELESATRSLLLRSRGDPLAVPLVTGRRFTYPDILYLAYRSHEGVLGEKEALKNYYKYQMDKAFQAPLLLPGLHSLEKGLSESGSNSGTLKSVRWWLADLWLF